MKLIKHIIFADVDENSKLIINSLNGTIDEVGLLAYETINKWKGTDDIIASTDEEAELLENLQKRGYLVENEAEEVAQKQKVLGLLRDYYSLDRQKCRHITFIMTYDCNFRCPYCFEGEANARKNVMSNEMIDSALNLTGNDIESVLLFGGEPLLPKNKSAIEYIISKLPDVSYEIITNGYYLEEFLDILTTIKLSYMMITLDGHKESHDSRRFLANNKPTYDKILNGITKCLENGLNIRIRMNLDYGNFEEGVDLKKHLLEKFSEYGDLLSFEMSPMLGDADETRNKITSEMFCDSVEHEQKERLRQNRILGSLNPIINSLTVGIPIRPLYSFCYAHENKIVVDPYGNIFTCLLTVGEDNLASGKYHPTVEFKENSIYNRNIDKIPECRECIYSLLCGGGCAMRIPDKSDVFKPVCSSIKNQIHNLLPQLYRIEKEHRNEVSL